MLYRKLFQKKRRAKQDSSPASCANLPLPILWIHPKDGSILFTNTAAEHLTGYRKKDLRSRSVSSLFPENLPGNLGISLNMRRRHSSTCRHSMYAVLVRNRGSPRLIRLTLDFPRQIAGYPRLIRICLTNVEGLDSCSGGDLETPSRPSASGTRPREGSVITSLIRWIKSVFA